jgi:adenylosuccinate lyase
MSKVLDEQFGLIDENLAKQALLGKPKKLGSLELAELTAVSPLDGRYRRNTKDLAEFYSEFGLIRYRIHVEVEYFLALMEKLPVGKTLPVDIPEKLRKVVDNLTVEQAAEIKATEKITNHDVKAVEYFIKARFDELGLHEFKEWVHFALTSQDINNTSTPALFRDSLESAYLPSVEALLQKLKANLPEWDLPMLAKTHGQPASPTNLAKEFKVFIERIETQLHLLRQIPHGCKFGGATGNMNAHLVTFPDIDWRDFANNFCESRLGLKRQQFTTQIEHYDTMGAIFDGIKRINTILLDLCRDVWMYVSMEYFKQRIVAGEVGSSAMPHKVNPIDFENAEGNFGMANALFEHLSQKLPVSRLQRDLTDSTVLRNIGVPMGHTAIAMASLQKGLGKLLVNKAAIDADLEKNWAVVAEAIQNILRREAYPNPYEALRDLTRTNEVMNQARIHAFVDGLNISDSLKSELKQVTPFNYVGYS